MQKKDDDMATRAGSASTLPLERATVPTDGDGLEDFIDMVLAPETDDERAYREEETERERRRRERVPSPGPWSYEDTMDASCGSSFCTPDGCMENHRAGLYRIVGPDWYDYDVVYPDVVCNEADARLLSAAPELYAALKLYVEHYGDPLKVARAALRKAEGPQRGSGQ